ncbi:hypothetical protein M1116_01670 [Patescibacteria group bacterium]|nr:hypothetical protein [Patescibacteria group bacterium]
MLSNATTLILFITKIFAIVGAVLYFIFGLIVVKQVGMMTRSVNDKFNGILTVFSYLHLAFCLFLILMTIVVL